MILKKQKQTSINQSFPAIHRPTEKKKKKKLLVSFIQDWLLLLQIPQVLHSSAAYDEVQVLLQPGYVIPGL